MQGSNAKRLWEEPPGKRPNAIIPGGLLSGTSKIRFPGKSSLGWFALKKGTREVVHSDNSIFEAKNKKSQKNSNAKLPGKNVT